jgi:alginate O-acetyltransferase complex protein AlgI
LVFSSPVFLYLFLPIVLILHFGLGKKLRNVVLIIASLFFYTWGEQEYALIILISIALNHIFGLLLARLHSSPKRKLILALAVIINIGLLAYFKYANFFINNINSLLRLGQIPLINLPPVHLPLGISFFTFHALSYLIDVYRSEVQAQKNPLLTTLYISLFPQLVAGPIIRYHDVASQLATRLINREGFATGIRRFIVGLGKKMLIAHVVAVPVDQIFALPANQLTVGLAWLGVICYALQIYFDFSGYSDMAIGLGLMFGFRFLENFNYPYISQSIQEFWRRWHISLSNWFRDYLYIPLGGNRCAPWRVYFNLITVFFLCGLWHGASWTFAIWGLYHGAFLVIERLGFGRWLARRWQPVRHLYAVLVVMAGWVLFRAETITGALAILGAMVGFSRGTGLEYNVTLYLNAELGLALAVGIIGSTPWLNYLGRWYKHLMAAYPQKIALLVEGSFSFVEVVMLTLIFLASSMQLAAGTHNPFIYFRF